MTRNDKKEKEETGNHPKKNRNKQTAALQLRSSPHTHLDIFVVERRFEVGEWRGAGRGVGHHLETAIDQALVKHLLQHPPDTLHKGRVQSLTEQQDEEKGNKSKTRTRREREERSRNVPTQPMTE